MDFCDIMLLVKILGVVDIIAGLVILFNVHTGLDFLLFVILFVKGLASMMADNIGKVYGAFDILAAFLILFAINTGIGIAVLLFLFFVYKGLVSLMPAG